MTVMDSIDFGKLTSQKLKKIKDMQENANISKISDLNASDIKIDFSKTDSTFSAGKDMINISIAANLAGMSYSEFTATSKEEQNKYWLLATLMDANNDGKVNVNEMQEVMALSGKESSENFDQADIEQLLKIVNDAGIDELLSDIDGVIKREEEEAREATHSFTDFGNGMQIHIYGDEEAYVINNGERIDAVTKQDDGSYTFELDGETKVFKANDSKGIDFYNSTLEYSESTLNINSELDEDFSQCGTGDCYFLATLNSIKQFRDGNTILRNSIVHNEKDHTYTVNFKGIDMSYTFTADQIREAEQKRYNVMSDDGSVVKNDASWYSEGDDDVLLLEMAFEQFRLECYEGKHKDKSWPKEVKFAGTYSGDKENESPLKNGSFSQVIYVLTGKTEMGSYDIHNTLDELQKSQDDCSLAIVATLSANNGYTKDDSGDYYIKKDDKSYHKVTTETPSDAERYSFTGAGSNKGGIILNGVGESEGQKISISSNGTGNHLLSITNISDDTVTIINPWDSSKEVTVNREDLEGYMIYVGYSDVKDHSIPEYRNYDPSKNTTVEEKKPGVWDKIKNFFKNLFR